MGEKEVELLSVAKIESHKETDKFLWADEIFSGIMT